MDLRGRKHEDRENCIMKGCQICRLLFTKYYYGTNHEGLGHVARTEELFKQDSSPFSKFQLLRYFFRLHPSCY